MHLGLKSAVFVVMASVLWRVADARNLSGEFYGVNVFVAFLLLRVFKCSALVFCDVPPFTLVDIYQHFGGKQVPPKRILDYTTSLPQKDVFFIVKAERDQNLAAVLIRVALLLYSAGFGLAQFVFICIRTSWILLQNYRC